MPRVRGVPFQHSLLEAAEIEVGHEGIALGNRRVNDRLVHATRRGKTPFEQLHASEDEYLVRFGAREFERLVERARTTPGTAV